MREVRERGRRITCVDNFMPLIMQDEHMLWSSIPDLVCDLEFLIEPVMDKVRAMAIQLQTEHRDGH